MPGGISSWWCDAPQIAKSGLVIKPAAFARSATDSRETSPTPGRSVTRTYRQAARFQNGFTITMMTITMAMTSKIAPPMMPHITFLFIPGF